MKQIHKTSPDDSAMPNQEHDGLTKREKFAYGAMIAFNSNEKLRHAIMMDAHLYKVERGEAVAYASVREADLLIKALNDSSHEELK